MRRAKLPPPQPAAVQHMVDAVLALSDDPGPLNVRRYLAASRALEASRFATKPRQQRAA